MARFEASWVVAAKYSVDVPGVCGAHLLRVLGLLLCLVGELFPLMMVELHGRGGLPRNERTRLHGAGAAFAVTIAVPKSPATQA